jgi:isopentenyl phosphate kinase
LNKSRPVILKIGGSVVTEKNGELTARTQVISRLVGEIFDSETENLVLVHGGGSFGHPSAERYGIKEGFQNDAQKIGFSETHHFMTMLNGLFMDALVWHHVPSVSITPSSCIVTEKKRIKRFDDTFLKAFMEMGFLPVLYGDAVLDSKIGFTILSGDQLVADLTIRLEAQRVIMGVDVDGLFTADPKTDGNAKRFSHLNLKEFKELQERVGKPTVPDVTGGMVGKISELLPVIEKGVPVIFVNATKPDYVYKTLRGEDVDSTLVERE